MISDDERRAYVALALTEGIGPGRLDSLRKFFGTWTGALEAPVALLGSVPAMNRRVAAAVQGRDRARVDRVLTDVAACGAWLLCPFDPDFPGVLPHLATPPTLLFGLGDRRLLPRPAVAIVGSRHPTGYGVEVTRTAARVAGAAELVVVSGMARGLDAVAHWGALEGGGATIGVLGNGLGVVYPAANRGLYERVAADGLLLTEHPPGERPNAGSFPRRNRLISALARVTLVVEAAADSGALITAREALNQGKDVLAVPGPVTSRTSAGTNRLIFEGAAPYLEPDDFLRYYPEVHPEFRAAVRKASPDGVASLRLRNDLRRLYESLDGVPRTVDALVEELRLAPSEVIAGLSELEIVGLADREPSGYRRCRWR